MSSIFSIEHNSCGHLLQISFFHQLNKKTKQNVKKCKNRSISKSCKFNNCFLSFYDESIEKRKLNYISDSILHLNFQHEIQTMLKIHQRFNKSLKQTSKINFHSRDASSSINLTTTSNPLRCPQRVF